MRLDREKNAKKGIFAGSVQKLISLALPFILRTVIISYIGIEYVGINTLFSSVLSVLSLAELGFGTAIVYSMYEPIAQNDMARICALLNYYKRTYRTIGVVILAIGVLIVPFIPRFINGDVPKDINLYVVYFISLFSTSTSYFLFAYKTSLLIAFQRNDIISWVTLLVTIVRCGLQIVVIVIFRDYNLFLIIALLSNILNNLFVEYTTKKVYPDYFASGTLAKDEKKDIEKRVKSLFIYRIGGIVSNSADSIVISAFLGLSTLAIYGNYFFVISTLFSFLAIYYDSIRAGIGNKMALESKEKVYDLFEHMLQFQGMLIGWMAICLLCLYQDFIIFWLHDEKYLLSNNMVILMAIYLYSWKINDIPAIFKEAAGIWEYDRFRPLLASICNLLLNILLVNYIGLYGVVLSTIVSEIFFSLLWGVKTIYTHYFMLPFIQYIKKFTLYSFVNIVVAYLTFWICSQIIIESILLKLIIKAAICCVVPWASYCFIYSRNQLFINNFSRVKRMISL